MSVSWYSELELEATMPSKAVQFTIPPRGTGTLQNKTSPVTIVELPSPAPSSDDADIYALTPDVLQLTALNVLKDDSDHETQSRRNALQQAATELRAELLEHNPTRNQQETQASISRVAKQISMAKHKSNVQKLKEKKDPVERALKRYLSKVDAVVESKEKRLKVASNDSDSDSDVKCEMVSTLAKDELDEQLSELQRMKAALG